MVTESSTARSNFSIVRQIYAPDVICLIRKFRDRTRNNKNGRDVWLASSSTSAEYSLQLGVTLTDSETISLENQPRDKLDQGLLKVQSVVQIAKENPIRAIIQRKKQEGQLFMLDLMSYGAVHRELEVAGCTVALSDTRGQTEMVTDESIGLRFIIKFNLTSGYKVVEYPHLNMANPILDPILFPSGGAAIRVESIYNGSGEPTVDQIQEQSVDPTATPSGVQPSNPPISTSSEAPVTAEQALEQVRKELGGFKDYTYPISRVEELGVEVEELSITEEKRYEIENEPRLQPKSNPATLIFIAKTDRFQRK